MMKIFRRVMSVLLAAGVLAFLAIPLMVPSRTSGTLGYRQAAGVTAEFVNINGLDVHVQVQPYSGSCDCSEPVFVLLHGFGASTFSWRDVMAPLSDLGAVVAYDRPGFGFTERPVSWTKENPYGDEGNLSLLRGLIHRFASGHSVILVGHSAGGALAAEYALRHPGEVSGLVLVDPAIITTGGIPRWLTPVLSLPQIDTLGPYLVSGIASSGEQILDQSFSDPTKLTQDIRAGYRKPLTVAGWERAFWEFVKAPRLADLDKRVDNIDVPTLLITGEADKIVPPDDATKLASIIPDATLVVIPEAGHLPHEEQSEMFMVAVRNWFTLLHVGDS